MVNIYNNRYSPKKDNPSHGSVGLFEEAFPEGKLLFGAPQHTRNSTDLLEKE